MGIEVGKYSTVQSTAGSTKQQRSGLQDLLSKDIQLFGSRMSDRKKERFYSEMHALFVAGVDIKTALELVEAEQPKKADQQVFKKLTDNVVRGESLSQAMEKTGVFSQYEYYSVKIGEESGELLRVFEELAVYFEKRIALKRQLVSVLTYPSFVLGIAIGVVWFMLNFIVPMFADLFARQDANLPGITQFVMDLSVWFGIYFKYVMLVVAVTALVIFTQRKTVAVRKAMAAFQLRLPLFGTTIRKAYLARFCQAMNLLITAKTPLVEAVGLVRSMISFYPMEESLAKIEEDLTKGKSLNESLAKFSIYERRMVSLIRVAEEVNQLDSMFGRLAKQYSEDVEHQTKTMGSVLEPVIIVFIAVVVGGILVAMYMPMFNFQELIK